VIATETAGKTPPDSDRRTTLAESAACLGSRRCFSQAAGAFFFGEKTKQ
jgi:hypothetical protein